MDHVPEAGRIVAICDCYRQRYIETLAQKKTDWQAYQYHRAMIDNALCQQGCCAIQVT